jgi:hypothetical protein
MLRKLWHGLVWSAVIGPGLFGAAAYSWDWWWPTVSRSAPEVYDVLVQRTSVPNWLLGLLMVMALFFTAMVVGAVLPRRPRWRSYTEDTFFGLVWRWRYSIVVGEGLPVDLTAFCPRCDFEVRHEPASGDRAVEGIAYRCDGCSLPLGTFNESAFSLHSKVERFVQQRIRKQTWVRSRSRLR